ncbi:hypothetical protein AB6819_09400 [Carnobacterium maltaromaticum]|uniref:hypothetical protein n=1 Tax=Carnobacterium maltaromaticum TaxID=2751 RepID=UPI0039BEA64A
MAIKIQTEETVIPVEIGNLTFGFNISDDAVSTFQNGVDKVLEKFKKLEKEISEENGSEVIGLVKQVLTEGFDFMLGEGTFEKLYKQTPSVIKLTNVFKQLSDSLKEELESAGIEESQKELGQKYLAKKVK